jgi:prolipoprotein diacylglyceryltransferase
VFDFHSLPFHACAWGIRPVLFHLFGMPVYSYPFFNTLGFVLGMGLFFYLKRRHKAGADSIYLLIGAVLGMFIGAIGTMALLSPHDFLRLFPLSLFAGRTITGAILGAMAGVVIVKRFLGITSRMGNLFAPPAAIAVAIGRLGCLFRGCCYGKPTNLPWGIDFGDGIMRHPTQAYEVIFMLAMFVFLWANKDRARDGELFYWLGSGYFLFRFVEEFFRVSPAVMGLTVFQWISILGFVIFQIKYRDYLTEYVSAFLKRYGRYNIKGG